MKHVTQHNLFKIAAFSLPALFLAAAGATASYAAETVPTTTDTRPAFHQFAPLTDAQKAAIEEARTLRQSGKTDEASAVLQKAGLPAHGAMKRAGHGMREGMARGGYGNRAARTAIQNNDFNAWKSAMSNFPNQSVLTQDLFNKMVQVHTLQTEIRDALKTK